MPKQLARPIVTPAILIGAALVCGPASAVSFSKADAAKLALYRANGEKTVVLCVVSRDRTNRVVAEEVERRGGRVDYRFDRADFLTAVLPEKQVAGFLSTAAIEAVEVDNLDKLTEGHADHMGWLASDDEGVSADVKQVSRADSGSDYWPPRLSARPLEQPYPIVRDMDGESFRGRNTTYDGRGVVIAHVESFPDFLSPELQLAYDKEGKPLPKFLDVINVPSPVRSLGATARREGEMWTTRLGKPIKTRNTDLSNEGVTYRVPKFGTYRLARFELDSAREGKAYVYPMLRRADERSGQEALSLDVLWSDFDRALWIDLDNDRDFSDEQSVGEYKLAHQFGVFGRDDPQTEWRETIGYAVQKDGDYISVNVGFSSHATLVAGAAAASRSASGRIDGIAPGAQIIAVNGHANTTASSLARALMVAFSHPKTDVVLIEGHGDLTGSYNLKDGRSAISLILQRLVSLYDKPAFMTADNSPGMTTIMDATIPPNVMSVGAYQSAASVFANYGIRVRRTDDLHRVGSEGPSGTGALKPDFLSPANPVSLNVWFRTKTQYNLYPGIFKLPPGYQVGGGTSAATPVATGAAALLIGAAKQQNLPHNAAAIHRAIKHSARLLPDIPIYQQGYGLIQVDAAWEALRAQSQARAPDEIQVSAPVRTAISGDLFQPHTGRGLFEREGWRAGDRRERIVTLTRKTGPKAPLTYRLIWQGEHSAFSTAETVRLPLNDAVQLKIAIAPEQPGVYSAVLHLVRRSELGPEASVPMTIVVPHVFTPEKSSWKEDFDLGRPGRRNLFFQVPSRIGTFTVAMKTRRDAIQMSLYTPDNRMWRSIREVKGSGAEQVLVESRVTIDTPMPGVWQAVLYDTGTEFDWNAIGEEYLPATSVQVRASVAAVAVRVRDERVRIENQLSGFSGGVVPTPLGGLRSEQRSVKPGEMLVHDIEIENGAALLVVEIARAGGAALDADLHLFDCTVDHTCRSAGRSDLLNAEERVIVEQPAPGRWRALVTIAPRGSGEMRLDYSDYYTHPRLGALNVNDALRERKPSEVWDAHFHVWRAGQPKEGYQPIGVLWVRDAGLRAAAGTRVSSDIHEVPLALEYFYLDRD